MIRKMLTFHLVILQPTKAGIFKDITDFPCELTGSNLGFENYYNYF